MANPSPHKYEGNHLGGFRLWIEFVPSSTSTVFTITRGKEYIKSIVLSATGTYVITFKESWNKFLDMNIKVKQATYNATHAREFDPAVNAVSNTTTPALTVLALNSAGAATTLTDGDTVAGYIDFGYVKY